MFLWKLYKIAKKKINSGRRKGGKKNKRQKKKKTKNAKKIKVN